MDDIKTDKKTYYKNTWQIKAELSPEAYFNIYLDKNKDKKRLL